MKFRSSLHIRRTAETAECGAATVSSLTVELKDGVH